MSAHPSASTIVSELLSYACLCACAWHASRQGSRRRARLIELMTGVAYGVLLEALTIAELHGYAYGRFLVMLGPVPLGVGVGWGIILYSGMEFAERLGLPRWAAPAVVGLFGLNIDLAMDAVAIRIDMWHWREYRLTDEWFGVPYANFYAWFIVLASSSALLWRARRYTTQPGWQGPLAAVVAVIGSAIILAVLDELVTEYNYHGGISWIPIAIVGGGAVAVVAFGVRRASASPSPSPPPASATVLPAIVPTYFHLFFLSMLFVGGIATHLPALVAVSIAMISLSVAAHGWALRRNPAADFGGSTDVADAAAT